MCSIVGPNPTLTSSHNSFKNSTQKKTCSALHDWFVTLCVPTILWLELGTCLSCHQAGHEAVAVLGAAAVLARATGVDAGANGGAQ